jgi:para-nitrobenzyl esterase
MKGLRLFRFAFALAWIFAGAALALAPAAAPTLVRLDSGWVRGVIADGVVSFKGVPYAAQPVGELRWRIPQPVKPWPGVLAAENFGPACMQADDVQKSEDCLTLNVWRPASDAARPIPVMVWIYGGSLAPGPTSLYPADALARRVPAAAPH